MAEARVLVIYTGGTIGMGPRDPTNPASPLVPRPLSDLRLYIPGLQKTKDSVVLEVDRSKSIELVFESFKEPVDSSDISPEHWLTMAQLIERHYDEVDGVVILHGTDTMAFTSSALAFMLQNLSKPVVITGSQLPISAVRTDAVQNLINAVYVAGYPATGLPRIPEVVLCFWDKILRGCRATKISAAGLDGFASPNYPALGRIGEHIELDTRLLRKGGKPGEELLVAEEIGSASMKDVHVVSIAIHPAFQAEQLEAIVTLPNVRGVVLSTFGTGNVQSDAKILDVLEAAISGEESACVVVNVTQCVQGSVEMGLYAGSSGLLERGVVSGLDLTPEAAFAKLYWALATQYGDAVTSQMQIDQRGEQSLNLFDLRYGGSEKGGKFFTGSENPDRRFVRGALSRAVVRLVGLRVEGVGRGGDFGLRIFMNKPLATEETEPGDLHCVAEVRKEWEGKPLTIVEDVTHRAEAVIGEGAITLRLVALGDVQFSFEGLYLALFASVID